MGATEILQVLRSDEGIRLTSIEIAKLAGCSEASVKHSIKRLVKDVSENLEFRPLTPEEKLNRYGKKLGCRIHIYWLDE